LKKNNSKELSIQVNLNGLSFCILNKTIHRIEFLYSINFEQKLTPFDTLNKLKEELSSNTIFADDFDSVIVIHQNELATLVPKALYSDKFKADYLKFNSKILKTDFITQDHIAINNSVNVYIPYVNINNYIFETFGEFVFKHSSTILIERALDSITTAEKPKVHLHVNTTSIEVLVIDKGQLQLFNFFEYHTKEDFIYYVLFVFEQLKLDPESTHITLTGSIDKDDELYTSLYTYVRHVTILDPILNFEFSDTIKKENLHHHYLILNSF